MSKYVYKTGILAASFTFLLLGSAAFTQEKSKEAAKDEGRQDATNQPRLRSLVRWVIPARETRRTRLVKMA